MESYPPNLHQSQGINHLVRVLGYAPFVAEEGVAVVHLTSEDWGVVFDTLFRMETPREMLPDEILEVAPKNENRTIELKTADLTIELEYL
jgi:hypothetical protein